MKFIGILFILISAGSVGFRMAVSLRSTCQSLHKLLDVLEILQNEITFCGTPLPQAFALMAVSSEGALERIFSRIAKEMDRNRWVTPLAAMQKALQEERHTDLQQEASEVLLELAAKLGKYDLDSQLTGIKLARERLEMVLRSAEQEHKVRGKTYEALGICAALAIAILLL